MQIFELKGVSMYSSVELMLTRLLDHPYFVGLQAHPEFCTRPLNPSPPFLGLVAAACGQPIFDEQLQSQLETFRPPHPEEAMVSEEELRNSTQKHVLGTSGGL